MKVAAYARLAQFARAPVLQAGGHRFDPGHVHQRDHASARALRRSVPEGIQDAHVEMCEIAFVPSGHGESVNASCGGYHGILT
jgi:hypothetical protein